MHVDMLASLGVACIDTVVSWYYTPSRFPLAPRSYREINNPFRHLFSLYNNHPNSPPIVEKRETPIVSHLPSKSNAHFQILYRPQRRLLPQRQIRRLPRPLSLQTLAPRRGIRPFHPCPNRSRPLCRSRQLEPGSRPKAETKEQARR